MGKTRDIHALTHIRTHTIAHRRDIVEQDERASRVLQMGLAKEEREFIRRLRDYISVKESTQTKPIQDVLESFAISNERKLQDAVQAITMQVRKACIDAYPHMYMHIHMYIHISNERKLHDVVQAMQVCKAYIGAYLHMYMYMYRYMHMSVHAHVK